MNSFPDFELCQLNNIEIFGIPIKLEIIIQIPGSAQITFKSVSCTNI